MKYTELLASLRRDAATGALEADIPESWMQGRTTYGGLSAALSLEAALPLAEGVPVRSAQIAFIGPVGGTVQVTPTLLRRGKNTVFIGADLTGEQGIAARAIFAFGARRESALDFSDMIMPDVAAPEDGPKFFPEDRPRPKFAEHFNVRLMAGARPVSGAADADIALWMRHKDEAAPVDATALLAIGDAPPPAAMAMMKQPGAISSMTWMTEFLTDDITTTDGWFLARHTAQLVRDGYSSQAMKMWNRDGAPIMAGRQTIAVFA